MDENKLMSRPVSAAAQYHESKELSEIKGKMYLARQFPRDPDWSLQNVLRECKRLELASAAQYEYPKGDKVVKGPSIRLVEVLARHWGNILSGVTEIESSGEDTTIRCFAWDLETNTSDEKTFSVKHERSTKKGSYKVTDERDIYEVVANKGARRKRACLLALLPGWYVDEALRECDNTLAADITEGTAEKVVAAFAEYGITAEQISEKLSKDIDKLSKNDIVKLRHLYSAIKDGFVKASDAFDLSPKADASLPSEAESNALDALNQQLKKNMTGKASPDSKTQSAAPAAPQQEAPAEGQQSSMFGGMNNESDKG